MSGAGATAGAAAGAWPEGDAIVWCQGAFLTPNGKTAHGLVRHTRRYRVRALIDARHAGRDAGQALDGKSNGIPVVADLPAALAAARAAGGKATHFVIGLAPDGGRLPPQGRSDVLAAIAAGLHVDCGLHDFLSEDPEIAAAAARAGVRLRDVRKPPHRRDLHFFTGRIAEVGALRVALLGTDSAIGKRTTAWLLVDALRAAGVSAELVGTGQTAWMQGARYGIVLDSLVNDFVSGEIEHAVLCAWDEARPQVIVLEGQGSLLNPAYPGGYELLAAGRPQAVVMQHAPARKEYDGFPGFALHPLEKQIAAVQMVSDARVVAVTVNHEDLDPAQVKAACAEITARTGLPACDPLLDGCAVVAKALMPLLPAVPGAGASTAKGR